MSWDDARIKEMVEDAHRSSKGMLRARRVSPPATTVNGEKDARLLLMLYREQAVMVKRLTIERNHMLAIRGSDARWLFCCGILTGVAATCIAAAFGCFR